MTKTRIRFLLITDTHGKLGIIDDLAHAINIAKLAIIFNLPFV